MIDVDMYIFVIDGIYIYMYTYMYIEVYIYIYLYVRNEYTCEYEATRIELLAIYPLLMVSTR